MDLFGSARRKIGNAIAGTSEQQVQGQSYSQKSPLFMQTVHLLAAHPTLTDAELVQALGVTDEYAANHWRFQAQRYLNRYGKPDPGPSSSSSPEAAVGPTTQPLEGESRTVWESHGSTTASLTPEKLAARRHARVENAPVGRSLHDTFLLKVKGVWRIVGPIWFVVVTAGEVVDYLNHYMPHADWMTQALIWGVALFLELSMMVATYDLSNRNRIEAEKRAAQIALTGYERRRKGLAIFFWFLLALTNITGQAAFLWFITHPATIPGGPTTPVGLMTQVALYAFIVVRVVGMLVGDANTAFVLGDDEKELTQVARDEKERGEAFLLLAQAEGEHRKKVAQANYEIAQVDAENERLQQRLLEEKRRSAYHAKLDEIMMIESLERQQQRLLPPSAEYPKEQGTQAQHDQTP